MAWQFATPRGFEDIKALAKATGRRIETLLALGRSADPFFAGSPAQVRDADWFARQWRRLGLTGRRRVHLRAVHYLLVSLGNVERPDGRPYENTEQCWEWLAAVSAPARYLKRVPPDAFVDRRNPNPRLFAGDREPAGLFEEAYGEGPRTVVPALPQWYLPSLPNFGLFRPHFELPKPTVGGYAYSPADQPYLLEVWVEKSTMNDVLLPVCLDLKMNMVPSAGFQSISNVRELLLRVYASGLQQRIEATGKPARIFYISDFDPAGDVMPLAVARQIEYWLPELVPGADVKLTPLALSREQVAHYRLPRTPIKEEDLRKAGFEDVYGQGAVELDALEALHPGELARLLRDAASPYVDRGLERRYSQAWQAARDAVDAAWADATTDVRADLDAIADEAQTTAARYWKELGELDARLQADLAPLRERLERVRHATEQRIDHFQVDLPAPPEPEVDLPDEDAWLFDASRDYLEQLAAYKGRRGEDVAEVVVYADGLTNAQRKMLGAIRDAGGGATAKALMGALGITTWVPVNRRLVQLAELGLVEPTGTGTKNDPRVWRLVERDGGSAGEAAG